MRNALTWAVIGVAAAALVPLAWLQYRWIGRVSEAERERMGTQLRIVANTLREAFDEQIAAVVVPLTGPGALPERYARWADSTPHRELVKACYLSRGGELFRLDPATLRLEPAEWPERLARLRARMALPGPSADESIPAVALPQTLRAPPPAPLRIPAWVIVEFDLEYIRGRLLPPLVERFFGRDYHVRVATRGTVIYDSPPGLPAGHFDNADARAPLFPVVAGRPPREGGVPHARLPARPAAWQLMVRSAAGSLDEVVGQTRRRNLAISFGVLLLLAAGMAVLLVTTRRAERLAAQQLEFVAGVSHELRTPLTVICSAADTLADGFVANDAQARRYGSLIRTEAQRLGRMVEQVLGFAGIQSGRARYSFEPLEAGPVLERAVASCGGGVRTTIDPQLPLVLADPAALQHCLRNLVENALIHGGQDVRAAARRAGANVEFVIEDSGPGIAPADLPHVCEPFYRGRRAVRDQTRGFGLGLALARRIAEAHSGVMLAENAAPHGARFTVRLPALQDGNGGTQDTADRG